MATLVAMEVKSPLAAAPAAVEKWLGKPDPNKNMEAAYQNIALDVYIFTWLLVSDSYCAHKKSCFDTWLFSGSPLRFLCLFSKNPTIKTQKFHIDHQLFRDLKWHQWSSVSLPAFPVASVSFTSPCQVTRIGCYGLNFPRSWRLRNLAPKKREFFMAPHGTPPKNRYLPSGKLT